MVNGEKSQKRILEGKVIVSRAMKEKIGLVDYNTL